MSDFENIPYITSNFAPIEGEIKSDPSHFVVEEIPLYEPEGEGEHIYVCLTREGSTTGYIRKQLAQIFGLKEVEIGYAGMKDKYARSTQTFSLQLHNINENEVRDRIMDNLPVEIKYVKRHKNKLRVGHLIGNKFEIVLKTSQPDAYENAIKIKDELIKIGIPNFYGVQRFGIHSDNALRGKEVLMGKSTRKHWLDNFLLSAYQSALFNRWLTRRINNGWYNTLLKGDIAKKTDTGGLFEVQDENTEIPRFLNREITYTGPIYGSKMMEPNGIPGELEKEILDQENLSIGQFKKAKLEGTRRPAQIYLNNISITRHDLGLRFEFSLPKGSYATVLLREFTKTDSDELDEN